jgi:nitrogen fixation/metabolism regulation signal transduction histidine kinase
MARRLAHEIKNPLTPIQLAVQEVHQRLADLSPEQRRLLDTALEIVESEVQTLRRLVGEFSDFARLPESHIQAADLFEFLGEFEKEGQVPGVFQPDPNDDTPAPQVRFDVPDAEAPALLDRQLMRRVFLNLVHNAVQACRPRAANIRITAKRAAEFYEILFDDDGPGVEQALRPRVFEPYVTTKDDGTGLGLAIVKKIVIEHRGHIEMLQSPQGGARVRLLLPIGGSRTSLLPQISAGH